MSLADKLVIWILLAMLCIEVYEAFLRKRVV